MQRDEFDLYRTLNYQGIIHIRINRDPHFSLFQVGIRRSGAGTSDVRGAGDDADPARAQPPDRAQPSLLLLHRRLRVRVRRFVKETRLSVERLQKIDCWGRGWKFHQQVEVCWGGVN